MEVNSPYFYGRRLSDWLFQKHISQPTQLGVNDAQLEPVPVQPKQILENKCLVSYRLPTMKKHQSEFDIFCVPQGKVANHRPSFRVDLH